MKKLVFLAVLAVLAGNALADVTCETFPDPLGGWTGRYLGQHTNLSNYYVCTGSTTDQNYRGNNPCGLWICDGNATDPNSIINFDTFGNTVTNFTLDIVPFVPEIFTIYNYDGSTAFTLNLNADGVFPPCDTNSYGGACNGIQKFSIVSNGGGTVEGNTSITNVCATTGNPVPTKVLSWGQIKASYK